MPTSEDNGPKDPIVQGSEDAEQADWIAEELNQTFRYDHTAQRWHHWTGVRWAPDAVKELQERIVVLARERVLVIVTTREPSKERDKIEKVYRRLFEKSRVESAVEVLSWRAGYKTDGADWDQDPSYLGCENGIVDLTKNALIEAPGPELLVTKTTKHNFYPIQSWDECWDRAPVLMQSLKEWTSDDMRLGMFYILWFGYSLFGLTSEQRFLIMTGSGRNGKGALVHAMQKVFGEYNADVDSKLYMRGKMGSSGSENARADLMALKGKRLAIMSEPEGGAFNEELLKAHTGGDQITARALYSNNVISWEPTHSITFLANKNPTVNDVGPAMSARVMVADFRERFEGTRRNAKLYDQLTGKEEAEGQLAILVFAAKAWWDNGLELPERVIEASEAYITSNDPIGQALHEAFMVDESASTLSRVLYEAFAEWFARSDSDGEVMSQTAFSMVLQRRGFAKKKREMGMFWLGIRPKTAMEVANADED